MLVLSRRPGESLCVGDAVITLLEIRDHRVRIGIEAPEEIRILRRERTRSETGPLSHCIPVEIVAPQPARSDRPHANEGRTTLTEAGQKNRR